MGLHLTNKNSSELIHNVIMQSNPFGIPMKTETEEQGLPKFHTEAARELWRQFQKLKSANRLSDPFKGKNSSRFVC